MNKSDLIARLALTTGLSRREATEAVNTVLEIVGATLARREKVVLSGFGTFEVRRRAARTARNPKTGAPVRVAAGYVPVFRPAEVLREAVAGKARRGGAGRRRRRTRA